MAQKIVIKVHMSSDKCRRKAMALAASTGGVVSVELAGDDRSKVVVVGDVDSIQLTNALRRKVDVSAELVEVSDASKKKEEAAKKKEEEKKKDELAYYHGYGYYHPGVVYQHHPGYGPHGCPCGCNPHPDSACSIIAGDSAPAQAAELLSKHNFLARRSRHKFVELFVIPSSSIDSTTLLPE
uniref:HMA domain-containing protein n=1 Tax=Oryza punctata TaxID=4537 RepID=A0A0E0K1N3_ORYPU